jgi:hypothetical protein
VTPALVSRGNIRSSLMRATMLIQPNFIARLARLARTEVHPPRRCSGPTRQIELKRPARKSQPISPTSRTSGRAAGLSLSPDHEISPPKEPRAAQTGNPKTQENPSRDQAFLKNRILAQVKSRRSISRFRILHGRRSKLEPEKHRLKRGQARE